MTSTLRPGLPVLAVYRQVPAVRSALTGFAVRLAGAQAVTLLMTWAAFTRAGLLAAGVVLAARSLPYLLAPPVIGWLYDRVPVRRVGYAAGLLEAGMILAVVPLIRAGDPGAGMLAACAAVLAAAGSVSETLVSAVAVERAEQGAPGWGRAAAVGVGWAFDLGKVAAAGVLGLLFLAPLIGGVLAAGLVAAGACLLASTCPPGLRSRPGATARGDRPADANARILLERLALLLALLAVYNLTAGQLLWLTGLLAHHDFGVFLVASLVFAAGAITGNATVGRATPSRRLLAGGLAGSAVGLAAGFVLLAADAGPLVLLGAVGVAVWGWGAATVMQVLRVWVIAASPEGFRGRASGAFQTVSRSAITAGSIILGWLGGHLGAAVTVAGAALLCLALAGLPARPVTGLEEQSAG